MSAAGDPGRVTGELIEIITAQLGAAWTAIQALKAHVEAGNQPELIVDPGRLRTRRNWLAGYQAAERDRDYQPWECRDQGHCGTRPGKAVCSCLRNCGADRCDGVPA